ncbi:Subtilisin-like protein [Mycena sanguinolenta]|uniref:Subtilisin-like protein n=1 Tax=Mycena sanguinolenta TaxID=230812 RepID=A0A8H6ZBN6_9AGAR|nr:Subtilisin-like protein [Mycena sanguinolenta]
MSLLLVALITVVVGVTAAPQHAPAGWSLHRRADADALIPLKFSLSQSNVDKLETFLLDIADPRSSNYGRHWSHEQVRKTFRPSTETVEAVHEWLSQDAGIDTNKIRLSPNGEILQLDVTISEAERLLQAEFYVYNSDEDGSVRLGCYDGYTLPDHVSKHVDFVWPTTHFGRPRSHARRSESGLPSSRFGRESGAPTIPIEDLASLVESGCDDAVTLDCLRALYNFDFTPVSGDANTVAEFGANVYRPSDLNLFFEMYEPDQVGHIPTLISVEGGDPTVAGDLGEPSLDIELMMGLLGPGQNVSLYQVAQPSASLDPTDELLAALDGSYCSVLSVSTEGITDCGDKPQTNVISISYHFNPDINSPSISPVVQRQCTEFGKLSLTGLTFIASSGDGGVAYSQLQECLVNGTLAFTDGSFVGQLPASCPFITAVGATSVAAGASTDQVEESTTAFASGGGFSNNFARPVWQDAAVQNYLDNFVPDYAASVFNRSGRAYPDVAANGWPLVIAQSGQFVLSGGTSASAPIFASVIAAVNDARIAAGKSPVGFINPAVSIIILYSHAFEGAFNDVTVGSNPGCGTEGFPAAPGWDPVSGLGTPNFEKLKAAFLALP